MNIKSCYFLTHLTCFHGQRTFKSFVLKEKFCLAVTRKLFKNSFSLISHKVALIPSVKLHFEFMGGDNRIEKIESKSGSLASNALVIKCKCLTTSKHH